MESRSTVQAESQLLHRRPPVSVLDDLLLPLLERGGEREQESESARVLAAELGVPSPQAQALGLLGRDLQQRQQAPPPIAGSSSSALKVPSVLNWNKSAAELLTSVTNPSSQAAVLRSPPHRVDTRLQSTSKAHLHPLPFQVDGVDMFVPTSSTEEYFVAI